MPPSVQSEKVAKQESPDEPKSFIEGRAFPYVAPLILYLAFLFFEGDEDGSKYYFYVIKTLCVGALIIWVWPRLPKIRVRTWLGSTLVGVVGFCSWVGLEPYLVAGPEARAGGFDPYLFVQKFEWATQYADAMTVVIFLFFFRILGASVVVPIAEELFWRGFLMRFLINPNADRVKKPKDPKDTLAWLDYDLERFTYDDWWKNPLGEYRHVSFWFTVVAFSAVHGAFWLLAIIYAILIGWLFVRTKSLGDAIFAHAVTNFLLGLWVMYTGQWFFW